MTIDYIINTLSDNIIRVTKIAYKNYEIGSKPFVTLINATKKPCKIVADLVKAKKITSRKLKTEAISKALNDIEEEKKVRLMLTSNRC